MLLTGCGQSVADTADYAKLQKAVYAALCASSHDDREHTLSQVASASRDYRLDPEQDIGELVGEIAGDMPEDACAAN